jgi:hypothetical protein
MVVFAAAALASAGTVIALPAGQETAPKEDPVKLLIKARLDVARQGLEALEKQTAAGTTSSPQATWIWADRVLRAELALGTRPEERIAALKTYVQRAHAIEDSVRAGLKDRISTLPEVLDAQYNRLGAELHLAQEEARQRSARR